MLRLHRPQCGLSPVSGQAVEIGERRTSAGSDLAIGGMGLVARALSAHIPHESLDRLLRNISADIAFNRRGSSQRKNTAMRHVNVCSACGKPLTVASASCLWCGQPKALFSGQFVARLKAALL